MARVVSIARALKDGVTAESLYAVADWNCDMAGLAERRKDYASSRRHEAQANALYDRALALQGRPVEPR